MYYIFSSVKMGRNRRQKNHLNLTRVSKKTIESFQSNIKSSQDSNFSEKIDKNSDENKLLNEDVIQELLEFSLNNIMSKRSISVLIFAILK